MAPTVFISYRREGTGAYAGRLADAVAQRWGEQSPFIDFDSIGPGEQFGIRILELVAGADAVFVVIGPDWADVRSSDGQRRLDDPNDLVRVEVSTALASASLVVPVLVAGAELPHREELPRDLRALLQRNAAVLDDSDWHHSVNRMLDSIESATKLHDSSTAARLTERKVVTVVACATNVGNSLEDPEDLDQSLQRVEDIFTNEVTAFGGTLLQPAPNLLAVFGAPKAHEDAAERAIRAALAVGVASVSEVSPMSLGIASGPAVVYGGVSNEKWRVVGACARQAEELSRSGAADVAVVTDEETRSRAETAFTWHELLKGDGPKRHTPTSSRRIGSSFTESEAGPFVGRTVELTVLSDLHERAVTARSLQVATIVAEPGLGKSRLLREFANRLRDSERSVTWLQGRCLPYGEGMGYWALSEIVKSYAQILESDSPEEAARKLDSSVAADLADRSWVIDRALPLVGARQQSEATSQKEVHVAWARLIGSLTDQGPLVLVVEDLHWAAATLVEFLNFLAQDLAGCPLLLLVTARNEAQQHHADWFTSARRSVLTLSPLNESETSALVNALMQDSTSEFVLVVQERSGGSPLYAEQLAVMAHEQGDAWAVDQVPASIKALIAARIDLLPATEKVALQAASVVGKVIWTGALASILQLPESAVRETVYRLAAAQYFRPSRTSTMEGEAEYSFWHALVRDIAYEGLTKAMRSTYHQRFAEWSRSRAGEGPEKLEILAHHLDVAQLCQGVYASSDSTQLRNEAADAYMAAANRWYQSCRDTMSESEARRAVETAKRSLALASDGSQTRLATLCLLAEALAKCDDVVEAKATVAVVRRLGEAEGDELSIARVALTSMSWEWPFPQLQSNLTYLARLEDMFKNAGDSVQESRCRSRVVELLLDHYQVDDCLLVLNRLRALGTIIAPGLSANRIDCLTYGSTPLSRETVESVFDEEEQAANPNARAMCSMSRAEMQDMMTLDDTYLVEAFDRYRELAKHRRVPYGAVVLGVMALRHESLPSSITEVLDDAYTYTADTGRDDTASSLAYVVGLLALRRGDVAKAAELHTRGCEIATEGDLDAAIGLGRLETQLEASRGRPAGVGRAGRETVEIADATQSPVLQGECRLEVARGFYRLALQDDALPFVQDAQRLFERKGYVRGIHQAQSLIDALNRR